MQSLNCRWSGLGDRNNGGGLLAHRMLRHGLLVRNRINNEKSFQVQLDISTPNGWNFGTNGLITSQLRLTFTSWQHHLILHWPLVQNIDAHIENHVSQKLLLNNPGVPISKGWHPQVDQDGDPAELVGYWLRLILFQLIHWRQFGPQLLPIVHIRPWSRGRSMHFKARLFLGGERVRNLTRRLWMNTKQQQATVTLVLKHMILQRYYQEDQGVHDRTVTCLFRIIQLYCIRFDSVLFCSVKL